MPDHSTSAPVLNHAGRFAMSKTVEVKEDGRILIYYSFADRGHAKAGEKPDAASESKGAGQKAGGSDV